MTDDLLTTVDPYVGLDEMAADFAYHLTRDELLMFIVALVEERDEEGFADNVIAELKDMSDDRPYTTPPEDIDGHDPYRTY